VLAVANSGDRIGLHRSFGIDCCEVRARSSEPLRYGSSPHRPPPRHYPWRTAHGRGARHRPGRWTQFPPSGLSDPAMSRRLAAGLRPHLDTVDVLAGTPACTCSSAVQLVSLKRLLAELGEDEDTPLPRSTFDDWLAKGAAPLGFKLPNGQWRFRRAAVEAWLTRLEQGCS